MAGPNQTGATLQSPMSSSMGYGNSLLSQVSDEELARRKKAMQAAGGTQSPTAPALSSYLGYSAPSVGGFQGPGG